MYKKLIDKTTTVELELTKAKNKCKIIFSAKNNCFKYEDKIIVEIEELEKFINKIKNIRDLVNTVENKGIKYTYEQYEIYLSKIEIDIDNSISMYIDLSISINDIGADRYILCFSYYELLDIMLYFEKELKKI